MSPDSAWLADMLKAAREAQGYLGEMSREEFMADGRTQRAIELLIVIIGEAAGKVSEAARSTLPELPWRNIVGMRNRLVHHYFKADLVLVWQVASVHLPVLIAAIESQTDEQDIQITE
jgi:uncharacterized protein with HEPN domain